MDTILNYKWYTITYMSPNAYKVKKDYLADYNDDGILFSSLIDVKTYIDILDNKN